MKFDRMCESNLNRHMASRGFGRGSVGRGLSRGTGHQDYRLPVVRPLGIMFNTVNRSTPTRYPGSTIPASGIVRSFFLLRSF
jgi:hypothetical protein